jgi:hypothetical protein
MPLLCIFFKHIIHEQYSALEQIAIIVLIVFQDIIMSDMSS